MHRWDGTRGDQLVFIRFENPAAGIWTLYVNPSTTITGQFHIWLPMSGMLEKDVVFLRPDPDVTLTVPSSANSMGVEWIKRVVFYIWIPGGGIPLRRL